MSILDRNPQNHRPLPHLEKSFISSRTTMQSTILVLQFLAVTASAMSSAFHTTPALPTSSPVTCADYGQVPCGNNCMPPAASCCGGGVYCPAGEYCTQGGCCPNGEVCYGSAGTMTVPPTSMPSGMPNSLPTPTKNAAIGVQHGLFGPGVALAAGLLAI